MATGVYQFSTKTLDGKPLELKDFAGKVLLIVNTASKCGFTPQYDGLQKLHEELGQDGLVIIGFPCNQFGKQEPGDESAIGAFCQKNYGVSFLMSEKVDVNGSEAHPLYQYLTKEAKGILGTSAIKWNFTKFLIRKNGEVYDRYAPTTKPEDLKADIRALMAE
ncbi:glutathione peroxidase [Limnobacter humi]|uniref:Glutathione peroxidase n=1 Tax=Limnobacter humi TaxID=1778671 RepID=A0ABT1WGC0_9BURK|nr:glutathione peroxidase [Limnobacter humi]MCQ8896567.1 glutathione peroxidase [Limnobacter humi]